MASLIFSIIIDFLVLTSAELWEGVNVVAAVLVDKRVDLGEGGKENWTFLLLQIPPLILGRCCASPTAADPPHIQAAMSNFSELSRNVYFVVVSSLYCSRCYKSWWRWEMRDSPLVRGWFPFRMNPIHPSSRSWCTFSIYPHSRQNNQEIVHYSAMNIASVKINTLQWIKTMVITKHHPQVVAESRVSQSWVVSAPFRSQTLQWWWWYLIYI